MVVFAAVPIKLVRGTAPLVFSFPCATVSLYMMVVKFTLSFVHLMFPYYN